MADKRILSSILILWFMFLNDSVAETLDEGFYSRSSEGWFFYNEENEDEEEIEPETPVQPEPPQPVQPAEAPKEKDSTKPKSKLVVGSAAWLKANLPIYLNNAFIPSENERRQG